MAGRIGPLQGISISENLIIYLDASRIDSYAGSGTIWYDLTYNNNDATLINGPVFSSENGGNITFDGVDDYATLPNISSGSDASSYTVCLWYKPNSTSTQYILNRGNDDDGAGWSIMVLIDGVNNKYKFPVVTNIPNPSTGYGYTAFDNGSTSAPVLNQWTHITGVYTKDTDTKIYINGVLESTLAISSSYTLRPSTKGWQIGAFPGAGPETQQELASGSYGQIVVYNRALNDVEVLNNYTITKNRFGL